MTVQRCSLGIETWGGRMGSIVCHVRSGHGFLHTSQHFLFFGAAQPRQFQSILFVRTLLPLRKTPPSHHGRIRIDPDSGTRNHFVNSTTSRRLGTFSSITRRRQHATQNGTELVNVERLIEKYDCTKAFRIKMGLTITERGEENHGRRTFTKTQTGQ